MTKITTALSLYNALGGGIQTGKEYACKCPAHDDSKPSLYLTDGDKGVVWFCHAGCTQDEVFKALKKLELLPEKTFTPTQSNLPKGVPYVWPPSAFFKKRNVEPSPENQKRYVKHWLYRDLAGEVIGITVRYEGHGKKDIIPFFQKWERGGGSWRSGHADKENRPLYGIQLLADLIDTRAIVIVEGEKCADAVNAKGSFQSGLTALTWPGGAKVVHKANWAVLSAIPKDMPIYLWPDWDKAGTRAMDAVFEKLKSYGLSPLFINSKELLKAEPTEGFDCADYIQDGGIVDYGSISYYAKPEAVSAFHNDPSVDIDESIACTEDESSEGIGLSTPTPDGLRTPQTGDHAENVSDGENSEPNSSVHFDFSLLPSSGTFAHTDFGNALRLHKYCRGDVRYTNETGWLIWNGKYWAVDSTSRMVAKANIIAEQIAQDAKFVDDLKEMNRITKFAQHSQNIQRINAMIELMKAIDGVTVNYTDFDQNPFLFNCKNGVVDLRTGELGPHKKELLLSKYSEVDFDPAAKCPEWERFLYQIMNQNDVALTDELVQFLKRAIGYSFTGSCNEQCFFLMWGQTGSNGKSVFAEVVQKLCGDYGINSGTDLILLKNNGEGSGSNSVARLKGARVVIMSEIDKNAQLNEARVKEVTGEDTISARFLYKEFFSFVPQFKLWCRSNHRPIIKGTDNGIWRRIKCVPFNVKIEEKDKDRGLKDRLLHDEASGILNWIVQGAVQWYKVGLGSSAVIDQCTAVYKKDMDVMGEWMEELLIVDQDAKVQASELYKQYNKWCRDSNQRPVSQQLFSKDLRERGYMRQRHGGGRYYLGIRLRHENFDMNDPSVN